MLIEPHGDTSPPGDSRRAEWAQYSHERCGDRANRARSGVAYGRAAVGDLLAWQADRELFEFADVKVVDPTGAGDAFVAGLIAALRDGAGPRQAGRRAAAAASSTVQRLGGRPDLTGLAS
ncbi:hypothetical protein A5712_11920 [Mycobacterium sp. E2327]|nr:PfkB family carbohydrate kinase [Mycobacterium sp. E2327]OBI23001.1 hypothetical protein A5712_11920 [Mycobacterium sp. E2327]